MMLSEWLHTPQEYSIDKDRIHIRAAGKTDYFEDPLSDGSAHNAPFLYTRINGDFTFTCTITPDFQNTYDAGGLFLYYSPMKWVKFAFEKTDLGYTSVVCVVTQRKSDDANGEQILSKSITLRMSRKANVIGVYFLPGIEKADSTVLDNSILKADRSVSHLAISDNSISKADSNVSDTPISSADSTGSAMLDAENPGSPVADSRVTNLKFSKSALWRMARLFQFPCIQADQHLGVIVQSPVGDGCSVVFTDMQLSFEAIKDFRKGV